MTKKKDNKPCKVSKEKLFFSCIPYKSTRAYVFVVFFFFRQRHVQSDRAAAATNGCCQAGMLMAVQRSIDSVVSRVFGCRHGVVWVGCC